MTEGFRVELEGGRRNPELLSSGWDELERVDSPGLRNSDPAPSGGCTSLLAGLQLPPSTQEAPALEIPGSPAPVEPALDPRPGPLAYWRPQRGQILAGQSGSLCGRRPHLSPPGPQITADLLSNGIDVYPQKEFDEDSEDRLVNEKFRVSGLAGRRSQRPLGSCQRTRRGLLALSGGTGVTGVMALSRENAVSGPEGVRAHVAACGRLRPRVSVVGGRGLRAAPPRGPGRGPACAHTRDPRCPSRPQEMIPFAVVGSDHEYQVNGRRILGRKTKWGTIEGTGCSGDRVHRFAPLSPREEGKWLVQGGPAVR